MNNKAAPPIACSKSTVTSASGLLVMGSWTSRLPLVMAPQSKQNEPENAYSSPVAFIYIFNLIVGFGILTLPKAFSEAGYVFGIVLLAWLCFMSYVTATYVVEAMAAANAYQKHLDELSESQVMYSTDNEVAKEAMDEKEALDANGINSNGEGLPLLDPNSEYTIVKKFELGNMANMFFPTAGIFIYYIIMCLYLLGDLSIYAVSVSTSITKVICDLSAYNYTVNDTNVASCQLIDSNLTNSSYNPICFASITRRQIYFIFLTVFILAISPFTFFNMTKSKILQMVTIVMRYAAFILMIALSIRLIVLGIPTSSPAVFNIGGFPSLFGSSIYSFMCHHSLPGIITPMKNKKYIFPIMGVDFLLILILYYLINLTGVFAITQADMQALHSLNFFCPGLEIVLLILGVYLALFPVISLSSNFPIIVVTLRDNLKSLVKVILSKIKIKGRTYTLPVQVDRVVFPLLALIPPTILAFSTQQDSLLVSVTGSFPGVGVQYVIPVCLAFMARYTLKKKINSYNNPHKSPFSHYIFQGLVLLWSFVSVILIIVDLALDPPKVQRNPV